MVFPGLLVAGCGVFAMICAIGNWDWFMNHRKAQFMISVLSRSGARIFYFVFGLAMSVVGFLIAAGVIQNAPR